jgi:hypothetical protein
MCLSKRTLRMCLDKHDILNVRCGKLTFFFELNMQYEKRKLACRTLYFGKQYIMNIPQETRYHEFAPINNTAEDEMFE